MRGLFRFNVEADAAMPNSYANLLGDLFRSLSSTPTST